MDADMRTRAEETLDAALVERGFDDARARYRAWLKHLRSERRPDFDSATSHYENAVVDALVRGPDPVDTWIEYGRYIGELRGRGEVVAIGAEGRAQDYRDARAGAGAGGAGMDASRRAMLILFVPDEAGAPVSVLAMPASPSAAQRAAYDLLVAGRQSLDG
jgi:hypothetical protein